MQLQKKRIQSIQFGLFSPHELRTASVVRIDHPETLFNQAPKESGLIDLRLGTTERQYLCATCGQSSLTCVGHFGHIELTRPVFHVGYMNKIKKLLEIVCFYCSRIKSFDMFKIVGVNVNGVNVSDVNGVNDVNDVNNAVDKNNAIDVNDKNTVTRTKKGLNFFWNLCKGKTMCIHCQSKQPLIKRDGLSLIAFIKGEDNSEGKVILNGEKVHTIFKRICEDECLVLGFDGRFSRPEWMVISVLNVSPPAVRPSVVLEGILRGEDDLTHKLADIVKANTNLAKYEREGAPGHIIRDYESLLQYHVATLMDNNIAGLPQSLQKSGRPLKSISARLKGKEGRVRGNLMGKRVDFSARSVISPDSNISLVEVGVPEAIAKIHTFPERVTGFNKERLERMVRNGPNRWPGANFVTREDEQKIDLRFNRNSVLLTEGCVVERHMADNDIVLFNRQPTLHKMSMMAHRARIMKGKTFRLNLSVTTPYNADFDGDEMNLHMPQSFNTRAELENLCIVAKNVVSCQGNKPVMGIVQDSLVGVRKMTGQDVFIERYEAMHLIFRISGNTCNTSRGGMSNTCMSSSTNTCMGGSTTNTPTSNTTKTHTTSNATNTTNTNDLSIGSVRSVKSGKRGDSFRPAILRPRKIYTGAQMFSFVLPRITYRRDTVLIKHGILIKGRIDKKIVGTSQGSLVHILVLEGLDVVAFFDNLQRVICSFLLQVGFTMGIGDTVADEATMKMVVRSIKESKEEVNRLIRVAREGRLKKMPGMGLRETFEARISQTLNKARDVSGKTASESLEAENNVRMMVMAGSKGSLINISQVTACVGQQNVEGHRISFSNQRTLPHFHKDDNRAESRGFVENSYLSGLRADEFFFHAMGGREGLIDTAVKTAETGYIQRRLIKCMENCQIAFDGSVRNSSDLITFLYGDDGFDASQIERVEIGGKDFYLPFCFSRVYEKVGVGSCIDLGSCGGADSYKTADSVVDVGSYTTAGSVVDSTGGNSDNALKTATGNSIVGNSIAGNANFMLRTENSGNSTVLMTATGNSAGINPYESPSGDQNSVIKDILTFSPNSVFNFYLKLQERKMRQLELKSLISLCSLIKGAYHRSLVNVGEMVGTLASQSIGEPATQMTLNTFHYAGVANTITMGVPRLKELINVSKNIKTPSMLLTLRDKFSDIKNANFLKNAIEDKKLRDVIESVSIVYDPVLTATVVEADSDFVAAHFLFPDEEKMDNLCPWVLRLKLCRAKMVQQGITLDFLRGKIRARLDAEIVMTDENAKEFVMRVRMVGPCDDYKIRKIMDWVVGIKIGGVEGINRVYLLESDKTRPAGAKSWMLQTSGTNLLEILHNEYITECYTNDLLEICAVLGIEAARNVLIKEIKKVIESDGSYVNQRHLMLLGDIMTSTGCLLGITRHGLNRKKGSCLMRCTFEETVEILLNAATDAELTNMKTVSEGVMSGQIAHYGTGGIELLLDVDALGDKMFEFEKEEQNILWSPESKMSLDNNLMTPSLMTPGLMTPNYAGRYTPLSSYNSPDYTSTPYSLTSPKYMPMSPKNTPMSPRYSPTSPSYSPTSPKYSPTSPSYSPTSPKYSPTSPKYSPTSPNYSPTSPKYSPTSPNYGQWKDEEKKRE